MLWCRYNTWDKEEQPGRRFWFYVFELECFLPILANLDRPAGPSRNYLLRRIRFLLFAACQRKVKCIRFHFFSLTADFNIRLQTRNKGFVPQLLMLRLM